MTQAKRLNQLEKENARLKKIVAEKELDLSIVKEVCERLFGRGPEVEKESFSTPVSRRRDNGARYYVTSGPRTVTEMRGQRHGGAP